MKTFFICSELFLLLLICTIESRRPRYYGWPMPRAGGPNGTYVGAGSPEHHRGSGPNSNSGASGPTNDSGTKGISSSSGVAPGTGSMSARSSGAGSNSGSGPNSNSGSGPDSNSGSPPFWASPSDRSAGSGLAVGVGSIRSGFGSNGAGSGHANFGSGGGGSFGPQNNDGSAVGGGINWHPNDQPAFPPGSSSSNSLTTPGSQMYPSLGNWFNNNHNIPSRNRTKTQ